MLAILLLARSSLRPARPLGSGNALAAFRRNPVLPSKCSGPAPLTIDFTEGT